MRIDRRVDGMIAAGWLQEVETLLARGDVERAASRRVVLKR